MLRIVFILLVSFGVALAQNAADHGAERFALVSPFQNPVKGAPYSAEEVNEFVPASGQTGQAMPGNSVVLLYRDSMGRTRTERPVDAGSQGSGAPMTIDITDPVAGVRYELDTKTKVAHKQVFSKSANGAAPGFGQLPSMVPPPPPGGLAAPGSGSTAEKAAPLATTQDLGGRTIEGVAAKGTLRTIRMPSAFQGNDQSAAATIESWYSPELKLTLLSKESDPRIGERTRKLVHVNRAEPDPTLFVVPSGYRISE